MRMTGSHVPYNFNEGKRHFCYFFAGLGIKKFHIFLIYHSLRFAKLFTETNKMPCAGLFKITL